MVLLEADYAARFQAAFSVSAGGHSIDITAEGEIVGTSAAESGGTVANQVQRIKLIGGAAA
jgi:hypothetical protein